MRGDSYVDTREGCPIDIPAQSPLRQTGISAIELDGDDITGGSTRRDSDGECTSGVIDRAT